MATDTAQPTSNINFLAFSNPQAAAQQLAIQRQQALAKQLMDDGSQQQPANQLANPGGFVVPVSPWAALAKAGEQVAGGYEQAQADANTKALYAQLAAGSQTQNAATNPQLGQQLPWQGSMTPDDQQAAQQNQQAGVNQKLAAQLASPQGGQSSPQSAMSDPQFMRDALAVGMDNAYKGYLERTAPTDLQKTLSAAGVDINSPQGKQMLMGNIQKQNYIAPDNVRAGTVSIDPITHQPIFVNNAVPANTTPVIGPRADGSQGTVGAARMPLYNVPPAIQDSPQGQTPPFAGYAPAGSAPQASPSTASPQLGKPAAASPQSTSYLPVGPGETAADTALGSANAKTVADTQTQASGSPMRQNVYDNILNLSQQGVTTGPGQQWKNMVKGYVSNAPLLGDVANGWKDDTTGFQELNKFLYQNAQRNWQAAGGTGTDAQLEAFTKSNPNGEMNPQALQKMALWGKASEFALQAKSQAMNQFIGPNNENISKENQFENQWNQHFDPKVYQLNLAAGNPHEMQQITYGMSTPQKAELAAKYKWALDNGLLK